MIRYVAVCAALMGWLLLPTSSSLAQVIQKIALSGDPVPAAGEGAVLGGGFQLPNFNNLGQAVFIGFLAGDRAENQAVLLGDVTSVQPVAVAGDQAPGTPPGVVFSRFNPTLNHLFGYPPQLNDAGFVSFMGALSGGRRGSPPVELGNNLGLWSWNPGGTHLLLRTGDPVPGGENGELFYLDFINSNINAESDVSLLALSRDDLLETRRGFWKTENGVVKKVAIVDEPVPGFPGFRFEQGLNDLRARHLDDLGRLNFQGSAYNNNDRLAGIWRETDGTFEVLVREGQMVPGRGNGVFENVSAHVFNDRGDVAFGATLAVVSAPPSSPSSLWKYVDGSLELVVQEDGFYSFVEPGTAITSPTAYSLSDSGDLVFGATLENGAAGTTERSLWKHSLGELEIVLREGFPAPDAGPNTVFGNEFYGDPEINIHNQVAFWWNLTGDGVSDSNDIGIWAEDLSGELRLIVREGELLEVAPGDFRTIARLERDRLHRDRPDSSFLNDRGQVLFHATFTDGSEGIFISNLVAVPEASSLALLTIGLIAGTGRRRS